MNRALLAQLDSAYELFTRSAGTLTEDHSSFAPADGGFTAANQVAHAAHTIDWFISGRSTTPRRRRVQERRGVGATAATGTDSSVAPSSAPSPTTRRTSGEC